MVPRRQGGEILLLLVFLAVGGLSFAFYLDQACERRWASSGYSSSWGIFQGCVVHLPDGRKLPEANVKLP